MSQKEKPNVMEDTDSATQYSGPLVVLTSRLSASASEILAGAIKDYKRGIIVGDDHTFGKGTVQSVLSLPPGLGALKITTGMFFRPGGVSTQHAGVKSDILVPSVYNTDDIGEKSLEHSLPVQQIPPFIAATANSTEKEEMWKPITESLIAKLSKSSTDRITASEDFKKVKQQLEEIKAVLHRFGLVFDRWSSQQWLRTSGRIDQALDALKAHGALYEAEQALWFASSRYGDDKDRVVRKRDGELTYLAPDIAYHQWKTQRGYDQIINLWGPDHHGYVPRIKAAMAALGASPDRLKVRIVQLVTLSRHGKPVPMSKRQGEFVTFREILDEVGIDATRFFFLMRTMESHLEFDLELAKSQSQENPVYYVQYAHARICSIFAKQRLHWWTRMRPDLNLLQEPEERLLMRWLFQYPIVLRICAASLEPHGVTAYLRKLAESFHVFYTKHRVITDDARRSSARLALIRATRQIFANGLGMLGIRAPQSM
jgi:arginyl-tRNA synthetase